jgi:DnaK suppressor protein
MVDTEVGIAEVSVGLRRDDIRRLLLERRRDLLDEIRSRVRDVREVGSNHHHHATDVHDTAEGEPEDDLEFALIQMKGEMVERVNEAIRQCDEGTYGYCVDCGGVIASTRLRAMPFAVRCRDCQETREDEQRERVRLQRSQPGLDLRW